ncbi:MAG: hypothetical protein EBU90_02535 [Proteobacteria bacterium]|nr:hypothetical protein [Pseudomonadota bacterium]NBP13113.1 hypothetical protein [bacterium]
MDKLYLSWNEINKSLLEIHEQTKNLSSNAAIIGLTRGGLCPAVLFSHIKNIKDFYTCGIRSYDNQNKAAETMFQYPDKHALKHKEVVYVIDDICDTGGTLKFLENYLLPIKPISITLVYRTNEGYRPNYFGTELSDERWVVFPWEETK